MTRKHYAVVARGILESDVNNYDKEELARSVSNKLEEKYTNFNKQIFITNCLNK